MAATEIDQWVRGFLAAYFSLVAIFYACRLLLRKTENKLLFRGDPGSSHWWGHMTFRLFRLLIWGVCVGRLLYPATDRYLGLIAGLQVPWLQLVGITMMLAGFILAVAGHGNLADQWRSGIDPSGPTHLVTSKLYARTRNPMYMGVLIAQAGFFLALPSLFTALCLAVGVIAILNQVRLEEAHLHKTFAAEYADYTTNVRRWLPVSR